jgi:molecular chaperone GrpE
VKKKENIEEPNHLEASGAEEIGTSELDDQEISPDRESLTGEPLTLEDQISALQTELEAAKVKAEEYLEGWQRARADFANYKKRMEKASEADHARITGRILGRYLDVMDDFQRALKDRPTEDDASIWADGIDLIYRKLQGIIESEGVEEILPEGEQFDPNFHEAISQSESDDHNEGEIVEVVSPGFKIGDRIIRPAMVRIAK